MSSARAVDVHGASLESTRGGGRDTTADGCRRRGRRRRRGGDADGDEKTRAIAGHHASEHLTVDIFSSHRDHGANDLARAGAHDAFVLAGGGGAFGVDGTRVCEG